MLTIGKSAMGNNCVVVIHDINGNSQSFECDNEGAMLKLNENIPKLKENLVYVALYEANRLKETYQKLDNGDIIHQLRGIGLNGETVVIGEEKVNL